MGDAPVPGVRPRNISGIRFRNACMNGLSCSATPARSQTAWSALAALLLVGVLGACDRAAAAASAVEPTADATVVPPGTLTPPKVEPQPTDEVRVLAAGEEVDIAPSTTLRFERIVNDSRCPADVQCVWAGEVRIALLLTTAAGPSAFELSQTTENKTRIESFDIEFVAYGACPVDKADGMLGRECASLTVHADA